MQLKKRYQRLVLQAVVGMVITHILYILIILGLFVVVAMMEKSVLAYFALIVVVEIIITTVVSELFSFHKQNEYKEILISNIIFKFIFGLK